MPTPKRQLTAEERQRPGGHISLEELMRYKGRQRNNSILGAIRAMWSPDSPTDGSTPLPGIALDAIGLGALLDIPAVAYAAAHPEQMGYKDPSEILGRAIQENATFRDATEPYSQRAERHLARSLARAGAPTQEQMAPDVKLAKDMAWVLGSAPVPEAAIGRAGKVGSALINNFVPVVQPSLGAYAGAGALVGGLSGLLNSGSGGPEEEEPPPPRMRVGYDKGGKVKALGDLVDHYVRKVRKIEQLGKPTYNIGRIAAPASDEVTGWHITTDLPGILKTGAMTNRDVGASNMQNYAPEHVGGAYFYSDPRVAAMKREQFSDLMMDDPDMMAEIPILRAQLRPGNKLVPDEDVSLTVPWQQSYQEGSFATKRPVMLNQIDRIYSSDPSITKDIIRDSIIRRRRQGYADGGEVSPSPIEAEVQRQFGMEPGLDRATFLPWAGRRSEGNLQMAVPGALYELAKAYVTPGMAARGQTISPEDAANFAANFMGAGMATSPAVKGAVAGMAVKNKGGNWLYPGFDFHGGRSPGSGLSLFSKKDPVSTQLMDMLKFEDFRHERRIPPDVKSWLQNTYANYIRNEMGTPTDPIMKQIDEFQAKKQQLLQAKDAQIANATAKLEQVQQARGVPPEVLTRSRARIRELQNQKAMIEANPGHHLRGAADANLARIAEMNRQYAGLRKKGFAQTQEGKHWEQKADNFIDIHNLREYAENEMAYNPRGVPKWMRKIVETDKPARAYGLNPEPEIGESIGWRPIDDVRHLADELQNALRPDSGLPPELQLTKEQLSKLTAPQASALVGNINAWRATKQAEIDPALANNEATHLIKEYPDEGMRWVELRAPEKSPRGKSKSLQAALTYEGDQLSHCVGGYCPDVVAGKSRIFSLRDEEGRPHATVEVRPKEAQGLGDDDADAILQIKGKNDGFPPEEMQKYIQDFIRSGNYSDVGDLAHAGMKEIDPYGPLAEKMERKKLVPPRYVTQEEFDKLHKEHKVKPTKFGYANGGAVDSASPAGYDQRLVQSMAEQLSRQLDQ